MDSQEPLYQVIDTLAEHSPVPRQHELIIPNSGGKIQRFKFMNGARMPLGVPRWAAVKFAETDAFEITDPDGNPFKIAKAEEQQAVRLAPDEVVAKLDELTQDALLARCLATGGKGAVNKASKKGELIAFLMKARANAEPAPEQGAESLDLEMEVDEAA